ncbi:MAG TPA: hypothetical protein VK755_10050, partial [Candidatus Acidoferrales bacterium]|nr:hypothetical protein [Candidatus Acidoferrales bacterium]
MDDLRAHPSYRDVGWHVAIAALYIILAGIYAYLAMWRYTIFRAGIDDATFTQIVNSALTGFSATEE